MAEEETRLVLEVGLSEALARRLEGLFEDAPHDAKEEAMLLDEAQTGLGDFTSRLTCVRYLARSEIREKPFEEALRGLRPARTG